MTSSTLLLRLAGPTQAWDARRTAVSAAYRLTAERIIVPDIPERPLQLSFDDLTA